MIKKDGNRTYLTTTISKDTKTLLIKLAAKEHRSIARQLDYLITRYANIQLKDGSG